MKTIYSVLLIILFGSFSNKANAQLVGLLEQQIFENVKGYDSVLLIYSLSGMGHYPELAINGFGMKDQKVSSLKIVFEDRGESFGNNRTSFKKIKSKAIRKNYISDSVRNICFSCIAPLKDTAIIWCMDEKTGALSYLSAHDAGTTVIYEIKKDQYFYKYASVASRYQNACPTEDRRIFIDIRDRLQNILSRKRQ